MATSNCVKCSSTSFEVVDSSPHNSNFKLQFVQCASCGSVVGVLEYFNIGALLEKLAKKLNVDLHSRY